MYKSINELFNGRNYIKEIRRQTAFVNGQAIKEVLKYLPDNQALIILHDNTTLTVHTDNIKVYI